MRIDFEKLAISNFLSIGLDPVVIHFKPGFHIITGTNKDKIDRRNGVGKSSIIDALHFVLTGDTLRNLKKDFITNTKFYNDTCSVEVEFTVSNNTIKDHYVLSRHLNPSKCFLTKNGEDITRDSIANTTKFVLDLLKLNKTTITNYLMLNMNDTVPFMAKDKREKRKFIENIFNLEVFQRMADEVKITNHATQKTYNELLVRLEENSIQHTKLVNVQEDFIRNRKDRQSKFETRLKEYEESIKKTEASIKALEGVDELLNKAEKVVTKLTINLKDTKNNIDKVVTNINHEKFKISGYQETLKEKEKLNEDVCPLCGQVLDEDTKHKIVINKKDLNALIIDSQEKIKEYTNELNELKSAEEKLKNDLDKYTTIIENSKLKINQKEYLEIKIKDLNNSKSHILQDIEDCIEETQLQNNLIKELADKIKENEYEINDYKKRLEILNVCKFILGEEGIKSFIIKQLIQFFNARLQFYMNKFGQNNIKCFFDQYFEEHMTNESGKPFLYDNFSGAEKKTIDLACMFTFMDVRRMQGDVTFNICFYDELFDSSFDDMGINLIIQLLNEKAMESNEGCYVITHRESAAKMITTGEVIELEKVDGVTTRK